MEYIGKGIATVGLASMVVASIIYAPATTFCVVIGLILVSLVIWG